MSDFNVKQYRSMKIAPIKTLLSQERFDQMWDTYHTADGDKVPLTEAMRQQMESDVYDLLHELRRSHEENRIWRSAMQEVSRMVGAINGFTQSVKTLKRSKLKKMFEMTALLVGGGVEHVTGELSNHFDNHIPDAYKGGMVAEEAEELLNASSRAQIDKLEDAVNTLRENRMGGAKGRSTSFGGMVPDDYSYTYNDAPGDWAAIQRFAHNTAHDMADRIMDMRRRGKTAEAFGVDLSNFTKGMRHVDEAMKRRLQGVMEEVKAEMIRYRPELKDMFGIRTLANMDGEVTLTSGYEEGKGRGWGGVSPILDKDDAAAALAKMLNMKLDD